MSKARILVVEDEALVAADLSARLETMGYEVIGRASSGEKAVEKAHSGRPDLIMMDIMLQGSMDGIEAAARIHEFLFVPVVYCTAYADDATLSRAKVTEPYGYILKPFGERELQITIEIGLYKSRMEKAMMQREKWLATTLRSLGEAVVTTDEKGAVTYLNPAAENMTGWKNEHAEGRPADDICPIRDNAAQSGPTPYIGRALSSGSRLRVGREAMLVSGSGARIPVEGSAAPIVYDHTEEPGGAVLVLTNISERKLVEIELREAKERAEQSDRLKDLFIANISHEVRTPLNIILGFNDVIREELAAVCGDDKTPWFAAVKRAGDRLLQTIDEVLNLARMRSGSFPTNKEKFDLGIEIRTLVSELQELRADSEVRLAFEPAAPGICVNADRYCVQQAVSNLVHNALKFTKQGAVTISVAREDEAAKITVSDTGVGIAPEYLPHIFDIFSQENQTRSRPFEGIGLGLTLVKRYAELNDGSVQARSVKGEGSAFTLMFPLAKDPVSVPMALAPASSMLEEAENGSDRRKTLLVVEDDTDSRMFMQKLLGGEYNVITASSSNEVEAALREKRVDLIVMDLTVGGKHDGLELTRRIRSARAKKDLPIIALTAHVLQHKEQNTLDAGANAYVQKPFENAELKSLISAFTD